MRGTAGPAQLPDSRWLVSASKSRMRRPEGEDNRRSRCARCAKWVKCASLTRAGEARSRRGGGRSVSPREVSGTSGS